MEGLNPGNPEPAAFDSRAGNRHTVSVIDLASGGGLGQSHVTQDHYLTSETLVTKGDRSMEFATSSSDHYVATDNDAEAI